ncbi:ER protein BIG1 [Acetobacter orientalis]|uniref:ER protein BIG1 n=1 Tax=Acetobacter orientalis TaxID=146474 RepID=A0A2Z5ZJE6_9PROT|nr:ER protein BIG1 [Acetobacter orientalis]
MLYLLATNAKRAAKCDPFLTKLSFLTRNFIARWRSPQSG